MTALKTLVIAMAILIVVGIGMVGYGLTRSGHKASPQTPDAGFFTADIPAPEGMTLDDVAATADRVVLRFTGKDGDKILLIDPASGKLAGAINVANGARW